MKWALMFVVACAHDIAPSEPRPLPAAHTSMIDTTPKERRRMLPPEVFLRAYLVWFGGLVPLDVQNKARPKGLFDAWDDYLAAWAEKTTRRAATPAWILSRGMFPLPV